MPSETKRTSNRTAGVVATAVVAGAVGLILVVLPPSLGRTEPIRDRTGEVVPGSLSEKTRVHLNGTDLGMFIMAADLDKPVLLFLGGGPGIPAYFLEQQYPSGLEREFVVAYIEYRGTSLSYDPNTPHDTMTTQQYIADAVAVTDYLRDRFGQDRIYLLGHSFGTSIGVQVAAQHPERYHAYIAMSQIVDQVESEKRAYALMLDRYRAAGNDRMVKRFEETPILTSEEAYEQYFTSSLRDAAMHELGGGTTRDMRSVITGIFLPSLRTRVYTPAERINIWRGKAFAAGTDVTTDSAHFRAFEKVPSLEIPVYFLAGAHDYTCLYALQREYYAEIQAPVKGFYTFEDSAHSPVFEEPGKALTIVSRDVLAGTTSLSDED